MSEKFDIDVPDAPEVFVQSGSCDSDTGAKENHPKVLVAILSTMGKQSASMTLMVAAMNDIKGCVEKSLYRVGEVIAALQQKQAEHAEVIVDFKRYMAVGEEKEKRWELEMLTVRGQNKSLEKDLQSHFNEHRDGARVEDDRRWQIKKLILSPIIRTVVILVVALLFLGIQVWVVNALTEHSHQSEIIRKAVTGETDVQETE